MKIQAINTVQFKGQPPIHHVKNRPTEGLLFKGFPHAAPVGALTSAEKEETNKEDSLLSKLNIFA